MNKQFYKQLALSVILIFFNFLLFAQAAADSITGGVMRSHDKIYVVMAVCITILVVLILYLVRIDIKVSKKEKAF